MSVFCLTGSSFTNDDCSMSDLEELRRQLTEDPESRPTEDAEIKEEDVNREELFYFTQTGQYPQRVENFDVVQTVGNTVSIPEGSTFTIPFNSDEMNQLLLAGAGVENGGGGGGDAATLAAGFPKIPVDLANFFKMNGVKNEQSFGSAPHYVKYKPDENGKHIKIWECGICHKEFGHQYILMRHLPTHTDERKFQCKQCGKAFRQMSTLSQHRAIHSKLRPYICEVCQKTFNRVSTLISHRKTHTGLKPHRCHLCNKAFHQKGNLRNHIFTHTNERPYKCDVCQKGFNQMSNLMCHKHKAHQRVDKPKYTCQTCGKEFEKRIGLRNHEQYEHGEPAASGSASNAPSVKYTNGVIVAPINTAAMKIAVATNQVPFALLRPLNGIPVLVRVLPAGDKQMLVPATAEDLKKFGEITIKKKEEGEGDADEDENKENVPGNAKLSESDNTAIISGTTGDIEKGATVQIRIPVVASVVQRCRDGTMHMDIESPGPRREGTLDDSFVITATEEGEIAKEGEGIVQEIDELIETLNSPTTCEDPRDCHTPVNTLNGDMQNKILQKDVALNQQNMQIYDSDDVILTPVLNLDSEEQGILLPSGMFGTAPAAGMYEIDPEADESRPSN